MLTSDNYPLLQKIQHPADLNSLSIEDLTALASEVRQYLVHSVCLLYTSDAADE